MRVEGLPKEALYSHINGWSIDLTLAPKFYRVVRPVFYRRRFDLAYGSDADMLSRFQECVTTKGQGIYLRPQEFILASTIEKLRIPPQLVCLVSGRSSYARMGVSVELSQIILQPGHEDAIPLQIRNNMPYSIIIYPNVSVAQAVFFRTISPSSTPYNERARAKYPRYMDDIRSRYYLDPAFEELRLSTPRKATFDWNHLLNVLFFISAGLTAASWFTSRLKNPAFATAGSYLSIIFFGFTLLTIIVFGILFFKRRH